MQAKSVDFDEAIRVRRLRAGQTGKQSRNRKRAAKKTQTKVCATIFQVPMPVQAYAPSPSLPRTIRMMRFELTDGSTVTLKNGNIISSQVMSP